MAFISKTYQQEFQTILRTVQDETSDPLVVNVIGKLPIPRLALALQYLYFKEQHTPFDAIRDYCISTVLIQMGLNVHNEVPSGSETPSSSVHDRYKQLQVLAGDLCSGRFYQILAYRGDTRIIQFLSDAVSVINQARTNLYDLFKNNQLTVALYVQEMEKIGTALIKAWLQHERKHEGTKWESVVSNLLTAENLLSDSNDTVPVHWQPSVVSQLKQRAMQLIAHSRSLVQEWSTLETKRELEHLIDVSFPGTAQLGKTAEEC